MRALLLLCLCMLPRLTADSPYLRVSKGEVGTDCLEIAVRSFRLERPKPVTVKLVAVSHIGSAAYYRELQALLDAADLVLYEGVDGDRPAFRKAAQQPPPDRLPLQAALARALGLAFQLYEIDYERPHFLNSDLSGAQLMALFEGKEFVETDPGGKARMEALLEAMARKNPQGQVAGAAMDLLNDRPGWGRGMRWGMVHLLGSFSGNVSEYAGLPEQYRAFFRVLLEKRNEAVMGDLKLKVPLLKDDSTVAVFYGAAHMHHLELRLREEFGARETAVEWRKAFCGNLELSGLNLLQKNTLRWFVNQQVRSMRMLSAPAGEAGPVTEPDDGPTDPE